MDFSPEQQRAADSFLSWFEARPTPGGVYRLFGYAGTGKTTIAKTIAEQIEGQVIFAAFTGKAALVLNAKGCYGARTIHSLIYIPREKCASTLTTLKEKLELEQD